MPIMREICWVLKSVICCSVLTLGSFSPMCVWEESQRTWGLMVRMYSLRPKIIVLLPGV